MKRVLIALVALLLNGPISCTDEVGFSREEVQVKKKFLAVPLGLTKGELESELGKPLGRVAYDRSKRRYVYVALEGVKHSVELDPGFFAPSTHIPAADFFVARDPSEDVLVYQEATVFGYFYFSKDGRLIDKKVVVS